MNINKAIVIGRITNDLVLKKAGSNKDISVISFGVATTRKWTDGKGEKQEKTEFHNVVAWRQTAEFIEKYFVKGQVIYVEGRLETRNWEDQDTKKTLYRTEIITDRVDFGERPKDSQGTTQQASGSNTNQPVEYPVDEINPDDIPF